MPIDDRENRNRNSDIEPREREYTGATRKPDTDSEARRLDRERTGDAVNARTDELDRELHEDAARLRREHGGGDPDGSDPDQEQGSA